MKKTGNSSLAVDICYSAFLVALVLVATMFINVRLPISINGGLIHMGNVPLTVAAIVFGKRKGAIAGAVGMGLFDVLSGWMIWAPFTFVIRGAMGYVIGWVAEKKKGKSLWLNIVAVIVGGIIMIIGYYFAEAIIYRNIYVPVTSIPGNAIQILSAVILGIPLAAVIKKQNIVKH